MDSIFFFDFQENIYEISKYVEFEEKMREREEMKAKDQMIFLRDKDTNNELFSKRILMDIVLFLLYKISGNESLKFYIIHWRCDSFK